MKSLGVRYASSLVATAAMLAGCAGPQRSATILPASGLKAHVEGGRTWMLPEARREDLLYVSDSYNNVVDVYRYGTDRQVGELTGFDSPSGECVDASGDVWVTNYFGYKAYEFAHGGATPLRILKTDGNGMGCSINPINGDLAIGNESGESEKPSDVQIFKSSSRFPKDYSLESKCTYIHAPGYDAEGNLYFEATVANGGWGVCELAAGAVSLQRLQLPKKIYSPGSVMWDGRYITYADIHADNKSSIAIYQAARTKNGLAVVGSTRLSDPCRNVTSVYQPFIVGRENTPINATQGKVVVGATQSCVRRFDYWGYPGGGDPKKWRNAPDDVGGNSVSLAP